MLVSFPCSQNYVQYIFQKPSFYFQLTFFSFPVLDFSLFLVNSNSLGREVTGEIIYLMWEHPSSSQAGKIGSAAHLEFPSQPVYTTTTLFILTEITGWMGLIMLKSTEVVIVFNISFKQRSCCAKPSQRANERGHFYQLFFCQVFSLLTFEKCLLALDNSYVIDLKISHEKQGRNQNQAFTNSRFIKYYRIIQKLQQDIHLSLMTRGFFKMSIIIMIMKLKTLKNKNNQIQIYCNSKSAFTT